MLTVTTDPDVNRNELFRTPLRANYMGMKCVGLPRTALEADFLVSQPNSETRRWATRLPGVSAFRSLLPKRGCGCNCGCTLLHIGNVSSIYVWSSRRRSDSNEERELCVRSSQKRLRWTL